MDTVGSWVKEQRLVYRGNSKEAARRALSLHGGSFSRAAVALDAEHARAKRHVARVAVVLALGRHVARSVPLVISVVILGGALHLLRLGQALGLLSVTTGLASCLLVLRARHAFGSTEINSLADGKRRLVGRLLLVSACISGGVASVEGAAAEAASDEVLLRWCPTAMCRSAALGDHTSSDGLLGRLLALAGAVLAAAATALSAWTEAEGVTALRVSWLALQQPCLRLVELQLATHASVLPRSGRLAGAALTLVLCGVPVAGPDLHWLAKHVQQIAVERARWRMLTRLWTRRLGLGLVLSSKVAWLAAAAWAHGLLPISTAVQPCSAGLLPRLLSDSTACGAWPRLLQLADKRSALPGLGVLLAHATPSGTAGTDTPAAVLAEYIALLLLLFLLREVPRLHPAMRAVCVRLSVWQRLAARASLYVAGPAGKGAATAQTAALPATTPRGPKQLPTVTPRPAYWMHHSARAAAGYELVRCRESIVRQMQQVFAVEDPATLSRGRDVRFFGPKYNTLKVGAVWRIEAPHLWDRYFVARADMLRIGSRLWDQRNVTFPAVSLRAPFAAATAALEGAPELMAAANEVYLLHGTRPETINAICSHGMNERYSGGLFGCGTYFAEVADKTNQCAFTFKPHVPMANARRATPIFAYGPCSLPHRTHAPFSQTHVDHHRPGMSSRIEDRRPPQASRLCERRCTMPTLRPR